MTVEEIYKKIASHQIQGMMIHEQLANYYDFLGLKGYKRCHEYHFLVETLSYRSVCRYFINHHNKMIEEDKLDNPNVIPQNWFKYKRQDVDNATRKNAVKEGLDTWLSWERDTKELYQQMYGELYNVGEFASACKIKELIESVDHELKQVERYALSKKATDYNMSDIIAEQGKKHDKYERLMKRISFHIC